MICIDMQESVLFSLKRAQRGVWRRLGGRRPGNGYVVQLSQVHDQLRRLSSFFRLRFVTLEKEWD